MIAANHPALELVSIKVHDNKIVPALINSLFKGWSAVTK